MTEAPVEQTEKRRALLAGLVRIHNEPKYKLGWIEQSILQEACEALSLRAEVAAPEAQREPTEALLERAARIAETTAIRPLGEHSNAASPNGQAPCDGIEFSRRIAAAIRALSSEAPVPQSEPLTDVTQQDVEAYVTSLNRQGTPWADGCAGLIAKLWIAQTATPQGEPVAQYQVCRRTIKPTFWHNCPGEIEFTTALASGLYEGRKLYAAPPSSDGREPKEQT